jgi:hypothetical protein
MWAHGSATESSIFLITVRKLDIPEASFGQTGSVFKTEPVCPNKRSIGIFQIP